MFDEETEGLLDSFVTELMEAVRDGRLTFHEGCVVVTAPVGAPPEYITVMVDGINDSNVMWRGTPPAPGIGDVVIVWENTVSHRREIWSPGGAAGIAGMGVHDHSSAITGGQNLRQIQEFEFDDATILTINAGAVTRTQVYHVIAAQVGVADDLDNVLGGVEGDELIIRNDAGDTITVRHNQGGAGDFWFAGGANIILDNEDHLRCICDANGRWCDQSGGAGGALVVHDHFNAAAGGPDLNPERISTRVALCGPGLPNTTLGAAVIRVNALGPPALNSEWTILVLGRTTETGAVAIPSYCFVDGPPGVVVNMGAFTLTVSDLAGWDNVEVVGTANTLVYINNANPRLRNMRAVSNNGAGGVVFHFAGTSSPRLYDCIAEVVQDNLRGFYFAGTGSPKLYRCETVRSGGATTTGFSVQAACTPLLEHCIADDSTNFLYGLNVGNYAATVTTRYCTFRTPPAGTDVLIGAAATWQDVASNYDAGNINVLGTFIALPQSPVNLDGRADALILDADGDTTAYASVDDVASVKVGGIVHLWGLRADSIVVTVPGDFATIQAAVDWFKGKIITGSCKISIDAGIYDEAVVLNDLFIATAGGLELEGDTRLLAGLSYVDNTPGNRAGLTNGGAGTVSLSRGGVGNTVLTVTMTTTNPDFDADGWGAGDQVLVFDAAGSVTKVTLTAVLNNTLTQAGAWPANIANTGSAVTLLPNRSIDRSAAGPCIENYIYGALLDGLYLETHTGAACDGLQILNGAIELQNVAIKAEDYGVLIDHSSALMANTGAFSIVNASKGIYLPYGSSGAGDVMYGIFINCDSGVEAKGGDIAAMYAIATDGTYGFYATASCNIFADYSYAILVSVAGFYASIVGSIFAQYAVADACGTGYYANIHGGMLAWGATARNCNVGYYSSRNSMLYAVNTNANNAGNVTNYSPAISDTEGNVSAIITWS